MLSSPSLSPCFPIFFLSFCTLLCSLFSFFLIISLTYILIDSLCPVSLFFIIFLSIYISFFPPLSFDLVYFHVSLIIFPSLSSLLYPLFFCFFFTSISIDILSGNVLSFITVLFVTLLLPLCPSSRRVPFF